MMEMEDSNDDYITEEPEVILYEPPDQLLQFSSTDQDQYDSLNDHEDPRIKGNKRAAELMRAYRMRIKSDPIKHQKYLERERMRNRRRSEKRKQAKLIKRGLLGNQQKQQHSKEVAESSSDTSSSKFPTTRRNNNSNYMIDDFLDLEKNSHYNDECMQKNYISNNNYQKSTTSSSKRIPANNPTLVPGIRCVSQSTLLKPPEQLSQEDYEKVLRNIPVKLTSSVTIQICDKPPEADNLPLKNILPQERDTITVKVYNKDSPSNYDKWLPAAAPTSSTNYNTNIGQSIDDLMLPYDYTNIIKLPSTITQKQQSSGGVSLLKSSNINNHSERIKKSSKNRRIQRLTEIGQTHSSISTEMMNNSDFIDYMNLAMMKTYDQQHHRDIYQNITDQLFAQLSK